MKSKLILIIAMGISISIHATNLTDNKLAIKPKSMAFRVRPELLAVGIADIQLDIKLANKISLILAMDGGYFYPLAMLGAPYGLGGGAGIKWRINSEAFKDGWYIQPLVRILGASNLGENQLEWRIVPSVDAGYAWYWPNGFWLCAGLSLFLQIPLGKGSDINKLYLLPMYDFGIGYAW